jgi:hypothetical protein
MLGETKNQFSLTRVALSTRGRTKNQMPISVLLTMVIKYKQHTD